jgi:leucyl-tRNA synthetase
MLSPFAPYLNDELWSMIGKEGFTLNASWPKFNEEFAKSTEKEIVFQINGKIKDKVICKDNTSDEVLKKMALENPKIMTALAGRSPKRVIVVPNKLVNIVV